MPTPAAIAAFFDRRGWKPFPFQREVWAAMRAGKSGLLHATTGAGKTLAVGFGAWLAAERAAPEETPASLKILWITPMRALAAERANVSVVEFDDLLADAELDNRLHFHRSALYKIYRRLRERLPQAGAGATA